MTLVLNLMTGRTVRGACEWCAGSDEEDPTLLCRWHEAEYEGLSLDGLDRRDAEWAAEWADING